MSRIPGAGGGKQDELDKTKSPPTTQTAPGSGKENVARNLFDKTSLDDNEGSFVPERGEPEGESKQPVVTAQRQVCLRGTFFALGLVEKGRIIGERVQGGIKGCRPILRKDSGIIWACIIF